MNWDWIRGSSNVASVREWIFPGGLRPVSERRISWVDFSSMGVLVEGRRTQVS